jgi:hypothetical protein
MVRLEAVMSVAELRRRHPATIPLEDLRILSQVADPEARLPKGTDIEGWSVWGHRHSEPSRWGAAFAPGPEEDEMGTQPRTDPIAGDGGTAGASNDAFRYEARFTEIVPIGVVSTGLRLDVHFAGSVVEGPLAGASVRGIDYVLIRPDGVSVLDVREVMTTAAGERIEVRAQGYGDGGGAVTLPPSELLQSPEFSWPDTSSSLLGAAFCQTAAPELAWLNRTVFVYSGTANLGTGQLNVSIHALTPEMVAGRAGA